MFKGIYTPMVTIFKEDGSPDLEANKKIAGKLIDAQVDGIVLLGSIGEFFHFGFQEKLEYVKTMKEFIGSRTKLIVGTGDNDVNQVIEFNRYVEEIGADGALILSPYFFPSTEESLFKYYSTILQDSNFPVILYNFPERTSTNLSVDFVKELALRYEHAVGIKDSFASFGNTRKYIHELKQVRTDFSVLSGFDEFLVPNLISGGDGIIGGLGNFVPELLIDTYQAFGSGDFEKIKKNQRRINQLMKLYDVTNPFIPAIKEAVRMTYSLDIDTSLRNAQMKTSEQNIQLVKEILSMGVLN